MLIRYNVSFMGKHWFRTDWYSPQDIPALLEESLVSRFTAAQGFGITKYIADKTIRMEDIT